jgi:hypothetical protein
MVTQSGVGGGAWWKMELISWSSQEEYTEETHGNSFFLLSLE